MTKREAWDAANEGKRGDSPGPLFEATEPIRNVRVNGIPIGDLAPGDIVVCRAPEVPVGFAAGLAGSAAASRAWTPEEVEAIDKAIRRAAFTAGAAGFTADDVWKLCPNVPVTKGLAARLNAAARAGWIRNTGETRTADRGGKHDHGQRLSVWVGV